MCQRHLFCLLTWRQLIELAILSKWKIYDLAKKFLLRSDQQKVFTTIYLKDETQEKTDKSIDTCPFRLDVEFIQLLVSNFVANVSLRQKQKNNI